MVSLSLFKVAIPWRDLCEISNEKGWMKEGVAFGELGGAG